jgi:hypothetical protein
MLKIEKTNAVFQDILEKMRQLFLFLFEGLPISCLKKRDRFIDDLLNF